VVILVKQQTERPALAAYDYDPFAALGSSSSTAIGILAVQMASRPSKDLWMPTEAKFPACQ
jgi:hypothetical protein